MSSARTIRIRAVMACHNRLAKTRICVEAARTAAEQAGIDLTWTVVDDGCTDGTSEYLRGALSVEDEILHGDGELYWAGAMRWAMDTLRNRYDLDYLLLLNDDTVLYKDAIQSLLEWGAKDRIVVGTVVDAISGERTYGGWLQSKRSRPLRFFALEQRAGAPVDTFNANAILIGQGAFERLGSLSRGYTHSLADIDYGLRARKMRVACVLGNAVVGTCANNDSTPKWRDARLPLRDRLRHLCRPLGMPPLEWARFSIRFGGLMGPLYMILPLIRALSARLELANADGKNDGALTVVHVLGHLRPSGMERMLESSAHAFRDEGVTASIIALHHDNSFAPALRDSGYDVHEFGAPNGIRSWIKLGSTLRSTKADVVHLHREAEFAISAWVTRIALPRCRIVRTVHSVFQARGIWRLKRFINFAIARLAGIHFVFPSADVRENDGAKTGTGARVIENWTGHLGDAHPCDGRPPAVDGWRKAADGRPIALLLGNCSWIKGHERVLADPEVRTHIYVVHAGGEENMPEDEAEIWRDQVRSENGCRLGPVSNVADLLASADVLLVPSLHEGFCLVLVEALVTGCPVVISDVPGLRWASQLDGVVCKLPNESWAAAIRRTQSLSSDAIQRYGTRWSPARGAAEYACLYRNGA